MRSLRIRIVAPEEEKTLTGNLPLEVGTVNRGINAYLLLLSGMHSTFKWEIGLVMTARRRHEQQC